MILIVSGYRDFNNYDLFKKSFDEFIKINTTEQNKLETVIFGECKGVDEMALKYCTEHNINHKLYYANWEKFGKSAGPVRNNEMIKNGTHLLAFLSNKSKGTLQCIKEATNKKLNVTVVNID